MDLNLDLDIDILKDVPIYDWLNNIITVVILNVLYFWSTRPIRPATKEALTDLREFTNIICANRPAVQDAQHMKYVAENAEILACFSMFYIYAIFICAIYTSNYLYNFYNDPTWLVIIFTAFIIIWCYEFASSLIFIVQVIGLLHDIPDLKYINQDPALQITFDNFLAYYTNKYNYILLWTPCGYLFTPNNILALIDRISYKRQANVVYGTKDWRNRLGLIGCFVRDIVSDASKLTTLGESGLQTSILYIIHNMLNGEVKLEQEFGLPLERELYSLDKIDILTHKIYQLIILHYENRLSKLSSRKYMRTFTGWLFSKYLDYTTRKIIYTNTNTNQLKRMIQDILNH
jgi:hypothetical protein